MILFKVYLKTIGLNSKKQSLLDGKFMFLKFRAIFLFFLHFLGEILPFFLIFLIHILANLKKSSLFDALRGNFDDEPDESESFNGMNPINRNYSLNLV